MITQCIDLWRTRFFGYKNCSVYEIYAQSETPHLIKIAYLDLNRLETLQQTYYLAR